MGLYFLLLLTMAKNFPYFKFTVTEWMTGDIVFEDFSTQGLFINVCALYWQRDGVLSVSDVNKRYKEPELLKNLIDRFLVINNDFITIKFLDEQLIEANHISKVNSENGSKGGRPKKPSLTETKPTALSSLTETKPKKSKEEKEEESEQEENKIKLNNNIPDFSEFKLYALEKEPSVNLSALKNKYDAWVANDWKNGNDKPIKNWKSALLQTMPYIEKIKKTAPEGHYYNKEGILKRIIS